MKMKSNLQKIRFVVIWEAWWPSYSTENEEILCMAEILADPEIMIAILNYRSSFDDVIVDIENVT